MFKPRNLLKYTEAALIIIVWVLIVAIPPIFSEDGNLFEFENFKGPTLTYIPLFVIFLINRFVLVPRLLLKKKSLLYTLTVMALVGLLAFGFHLVQVNVPGLDRKQQSFNHPMNLPPPPNHDLPALPGRPNPGGKPGGPPPFANLIIMSILLVGFDTGLIAFLRLNEAEKATERLEKENVTNQLDMLRHQVSPHFLMNTLNNIHTLVDISTDKAKDSIIRLSKLMRYLLYDTADNKTTIKQELAFIESYVELMKLRVSDKVKVELKVPTDLPEKNIPPLLFTSFIENAFKHGISYKQPSFIQIEITTSDTVMDVTVRNSNHPKNSSQQDSGIGIENAKKRLDLLYGKRYELGIQSVEEVFTVHLIIPLNTTTS